MSRPGESSLSAWLVMAPALCLSIAGFGIPALYMARMSFNEHEPQTAFVPGFTFENYHRLLSDPLILTVIWSFLVFDFVYILTQGGPAFSSEVLSTLAYRHAFYDLNVGQAAAVALMISCFGLVATFFYVRIQTREEAQ